MPASINRTPAKRRGVAYCRPIFIEKKAVDHNRQVSIARKGVDRKKLRKGSSFKLVPYSGKISKLSHRKQGQIRGVGAKE